MAYSNYTLSVTGPASGNKDAVLDFNFTLTGDNSGTENEHVVYQYAVTGGAGTLEFYNTSTSQYEAVPLTGYIGADTGFDATPDFSETTTMRFTPSAAGDYAVNLTLTDTITTNAVASANHPLTVTDPVKIAFTVTDTDPIVVEGTVPNPIIVEVKETQDVGAIRTFMSLTKAGVPVNFNTVFDSFKMTYEVGENPQAVEMTGAYSNFQFGAVEGVTQGVGTGVLTDIAPSIALNAAEGDYILRMDIKDASDVIVGTKEFPMKVVSVETALQDYEDMLQMLSEADAEELKTQYSQLDALRIVVQNAIASLPTEQQAPLMDRYYIAAGNQFSAFKIMMLAFSKDNWLTLDKVQNAGGNVPYAVTYKDAVDIGDATEAYQFFPTGFRRTQTGISNYPEDIPDDIKSTLVPSQTAFAIANNYVKGGEFVLVFKIGAKYYRTTYIMSEDGTALQSVNNVAVSVPNNGDVYLSPLETAMQAAISGTTMAIMPSATTVDKPTELDLTATINYPVFSGDLTSDIKERFTLTTDRALPVGATIELVVGGTSFGTYTEAAGTTTSLILSQAFPGFAEASLNTMIGAQTLVFKVNHLTAGDIDFTLKASAARQDSFDNPTSVWNLCSYSQIVKIVDRQSALDAAIAGTTMNYAGDIIRNTAEDVEVTVSTTYPVFSADLDPELAVDTLITLDKSMPANATLAVYANEVLLGTYTEATGATLSIWLNQIINESGTRPVLTDRSGQTIVYKFVFNGLGNDDYNVQLKNITAKQDNFESVDARFVLASCSIPMVVTDKTALAGKITEAEGLYAAHTEGSDPGQVAKVQRDAFRASIDAAIAVRDNDDALRNDVLNATTDLQTAIDTFKSFVVKNRIDKSALQTSIDTAQGLVNNTTVGANVGQVDATSMTNLQNAITSATTTISTVPDFVDYFDTAYTQSCQQQIDDAKTSLDSVITAFQAAVVTSLEYAEAKMAEYETSAQAFYDSIRKKMHI